MSVNEQAITTNRDLLTSRGNILYLQYQLGQAQAQCVSRIFNSIFFALHSQWHIFSCITCCLTFFFKKSHRYRFPLLWHTERISNIVSNIIWPVYMYNVQFLELSIPLSHFLKYKSYPSQIHVSNPNLINSSRK